MRYLNFKKEIPGRHGQQHQQQLARQKSVQSPVGAQPRPDKFFAQGGPFFSARQGNGQSLKPDLPFRVLFFLLRSAFRLPKQAVQHAGAAHAPRGHAIQQHGRHREHKKKDVVQTHS